MSTKCARCGKAVYAAEQKLAEGEKWHNGCWAIEFKEREAKKKARVNEISYNKVADANASVEVRDAISSGKADQAVQQTFQEFDPSFAAQKKVTHNIAAEKKVASSSDVCPRCNKKVFHAEHRMEEGKLISFSEKLFVTN